MKILRMVSAIWAVIGIVGFLGYAIYRLYGHMLIALDYDLTWLQWSALLGNIVFMAYSEGYKGFQQNFSPRVAARILHLSKHANWFNGLLAPVFCFGFFGTTRKRQFSVLLLSAMILALITVVSHLPQPWRGIVDAGVVIGLLWGLISLIIYIAMAFRMQDFPHSPELPRSHEAV